MTNRRPQFKPIEKEADLDDLTARDSVEVYLNRLSLNLHLYKKYMVYEGIINGKRCFIEKPSSTEEIRSWRCEREHLQFEEGTIIFSPLHTEVEIYSPQKYITAKKLLQEAGIME